MRPPSARGRLIVVCGLPGAGKTTLAKRLERERKAIRLCPDEWMPELGIDLWDEPARTRVEAFQWQLAQDWLTLGHTVAIEWGTWARLERDALRLGARALGAAVELHFLDAPLEELFARVQRRGMENPPMTWAQMRQYAEAFQAPTSEEQALFEPESVWPDRRILELMGIAIPILQAPMAGAQGSALAIAVSEAGGLGALPGAMLSPDTMREEVATIRRATPRPFGLNFFCHPAPPNDPEREAAWRTRLAPYYAELGLDQSAISSGASRRPFDEAACELVEELQPPVVSFHFGLPLERLLDRVRATGAKILSSATTVKEARWLAERGCDAIIAQGFEAGGHRGTFLGGGVENQVGTLALVPQVVDAVSVPVIAAGGISDGRGIAAAFSLGASAVQVGTAYLRCPEAMISETHRQALRTVRDDETTLTSVFSGRPARGIVNRLVREIGPISELAPEFPLASPAIAPLKAASEAKGSPDFAQMWAGQAASLAREESARELTLELAKDALARLQAIRP